MTGVTEITELFQWNIWANAKYRKVFSEVKFDDLKINTPYGILLERIVHIFASFKMWHQRMNGESPDKVINWKTFSSWQEVEDTWVEYEELLLKYVSSLTDDDLETEVTYTSLDGTVYTREIRHILLHLTAHPNYHRGQISTIFKIHNIAKLPSTDMVVYFLQK